MTLKQRLKIGDFGKVLVKYASSQIISNLLRVFSGFLVVRLLEPQDYGVFTGISIYLGYVLLGDLGIVNGLGRELPYQKGKGKEEYARRLANTSFTVSVLVSTLATVVFLVCAGYHFLEDNRLLGFTFLANAVVAAFYFLNRQFLPVLYRTNADFNKLSRQNITVGLLNMVSVVLVWKLGYEGLLYRAVVLIIWEFTLLFLNKPYKLRLSIKREDAKVLLHTGVPIFFVGQVGPLWQTIINNLLFAVGGPKYFGLYALSNIVQTTAGMIPNSFAQVIYPRMAIMFGEGKKPREILKKNLRALIFQFVVMLGVGIVGVFLLPPITAWLLPKYTGGVEAAQWILFVPVVRSIGVTNTIFNVTKNQRPYFLSLLTGAIAGTIYILIKLQVSDFSLSTFSQGLLFGTFLQQSLSLYFIFRIR